MSRTFYDGVRMRTRYPGERKQYSTTGVVLKFALSVFLIVGVALVPKRILQLGE